MSSKPTSVVLTRKLEKMGYTTPNVTKLDKVWTAVAFDPLNEIEVKFDNLGTSLRSAAFTLDHLPVVPDHYVCAYPCTCQACGIVGKPTGYRDKATGDFLQRCRSCANTWVAMTAAEQEEQAKAIMDEALAW